MPQDEITHLKLSPIAFGSCLSEKTSNHIISFKNFLALPLLTKNCKCAYIKPLSELIIYRKQ